MGLRTWKCPVILYRGATQPNPTQSNPRARVREKMSATNLAASRLFPPPLLPSSKRLHLPTASAALFSSDAAALHHPATRARRKPRSFASAGAKMSVAELEPSFQVKKKAAELASDLKGTSIFLVGINCTMKSNLGKLLADSLRYYYFDSDGLVEQAAGGESAVKSFRERDEQGFRESETEVLKQLSSMGRLVVCAGDGSVQSSTNLAYLRHGISLWIDVPLDIVANKVLKTEALVGHSISSSDSFSEVLEVLIKQYEELRGGYGTSDATISLQKVAGWLGYEDFESVTPEDMAMEALKEIERLTRVKKMMEEAGKPF